MTAIRARKTSKSIRNLSLMASASMLSLLIAGEAQAACVANPNQPLNNITTPSTTVTCTGINNAGTIFVSTNSSVVEVQGAGSTLSNGNLTLNGNFNTFNLGFGATVNNIFFITAGSTNAVEINGQAVGIATAIQGTDDSLQIYATAAVTARTGDIDLATAVAGQNQAVVVQGALTATSGNGTDYLLTGGTGNQSFTITGTLTGLADGRLVDGGDGEDQIFIGANANVSNGSGGSIYFEGGTGADQITWRSGSSALTRNAVVTNIENAEFIGGAGLLTMRGTANYSNVTISSGAVRFDDFSALGANTANILVNTGATLGLNINATSTFNQSFSGAGTILQTEGVNILNGNSAGFSGTYVVDFNRLILGNANALGTANIVNNSLVFFGDFNLANNISGSGQVIYTGMGSGDLSGNNSFSGGLDVRSGSLRVNNVNALGTGAVTSSTVGGALLQVDNAANETLANNLTGNLTLVKTDTGVLDLTGNNTYDGGTLIDSGAIRVDGFARLGTGPVIANANGSLILNYNGAGVLLQTTPFMTGDGSFIKEGAGNVVMTQTSTYTGGTTIRAGRIGLNNGAALGTGDIQIDSGAELGIGGITLNNNLTGSGLVRKTASNLVEVYGDNRGFTGTMQVEDGVLFANNGNALGAGTLQIDSGTSVQLGAVNDSTVAANLAGGGGFEKLGGGLVTLTGDGSLFAGGIAVSDGVLQIAGSQNIGNSASVFINTAGTLQLNTAGSTQFFNSVFGDGRLVKTGTGTVFLTGNNTHTGGTDIQQGAIRVTDLSALGAGPVAVQLGAALDLSIAGAATYNGAISGAGILRKSDVGDLTLISNTLTGGLDIIGGRVIVNTAAALGTGPVTTAADTQLVFDNSTTEVSNTLIGGAGAVTKNGTGLLVINNANSYTGGTIINSGRVGLNDGMGLGTGNVIVLQNAILGIGGVTLANNVSGAGQIIKTANNTATLTGTNTHSGGIDIQQGIVVVNSTAALGSGTVSMAAGTSLNVNYNGATNVALSNLLTGAGSLIKDGSGTVVMNGAGNSYSGGTTINAGRLGLNFGNALGTGAVVVNTGAQLGIGNITLANNVSGAGQIVKTASGVGSLTGNNTHSGGIDIQGGTLVVTDPVSLGTGGVTIGSGAALNVDYNGAVNAALTNVLSGAGSLIKDGSGSIIINTAGNSFSGGTTINAGRIGLNFGDGLGTGNVVVNTGAILGLGGVTVANNISGAGRVVKTANNVGSLTGINTHSGGTDIVEGTLLVLNPVSLGTGGVAIGSGALLNVDYSGSSNVALNNVLSGAGGLEKNGSGTLIVNTGGNSFTGGTAINGGTLGLNFGDGLGTGAVTVASGATLALGDVSFGNAVSGAGRIVKASSGNTNLTGTNTHSGGTVIQGGTLTVTSTAPLGTGGVMTAAGSQLVFNITGNQSSNVAITGAGGVTKQGSGLLAIGNTNGYSGGTTITAGRLVANATGAFGTGGVAIAQGAELGLGGVTVANALTGAGRVIKTASGTGALTGINTFSGGTDIQGGTLIITDPAALGSGSVTMGSGTTLQADYNAAAVGTLANELTGAGAFVKNGTGTLAVTGASNSYSGGTLIAQGQLDANAAGALGTSAVQVDSGARLGLGAITFANAVSGAGQIVKASTGLTTLTGANTHTGGVAVQAGTLAVSGNAPLGTGAVAVSSGATLEYTNAAAATFSNGLSGAGTFRKLGAGLLTFGGNFGIGLLDLAAGSTRINTVGTGNVTVGSTARLDGTGRIIGNLTNNGIVAPGNSIGTLTVQGNYTHNANSVLEVEFDAAGNIDLLDVTGNATLNGGIIRFVSIGGAEGQGGTFLRTGGTVTGTFATIETVGALLPLSVIYETNRAFMAPSVLTARPSTFNAQSMAAADTALGFIDSMGVGDARHGQGNRIWLNGFGAWGNRSASGTTLSYDHNSRGMSGGVNFEASEGVTLGVAVGWAKGDITLGGGGGGGDQSSLLGSVNARYTSTGFTLGGGLLYGQVDQDTLRNVSFNGFAASVDGTTDSKIFGGFAELGLPLGSSGNWAFSANARGSYIRQSQDGYTESGTSPLRLSLGDLKTSTLEGQAGLSAKTSLWDRNNGGEETPEGLDLRFDLGIRYLGTLGDRLIPVRFAASNAGIVLQGDTRNTLQGMFGVGLDYTVRNGATFSLGYQGEVGKTDRHAVQVGVSFAF